METLYFYRNLYGRRYSRVGDFVWSNIQKMAEISRWYLWVQVKRVSTGFLSHRDRTRLVAFFTLNDGWSDDVSMPRRGGGCMSSPCLIWTISCDAFSCSTISPFYTNTLPILRRYNVMSVYICAPIYAALATDDHADIYEDIFPQWGFRVGGREVMYEIFSSFPFVRDVSDTGLCVRAWGFPCGQVLTGLSSVKMHSALILSFCSITWLQPRLGRQPSLLLSFLFFVHDLLQREKGGA